MLVGRLVANAFVPNPYKYKHLIHLNGDVCNNKFNNLKWVEYQENSISQCGRNAIKYQKNTIIKLFKANHTCQEVCDKLNTYYGALRTVCEQKFLNEVTT